MQKSLAIRQFQEEVLRFRKWAPKYADTYGEWECDYGFWQELWKATEELMQSGIKPSDNPRLLNDLIYVIARDNEVERLRKSILEFPDLLRTLALEAISSKESDAKWQIVASVADASFEDAAELIRPYLHDTDEYVRRRSLLSLAAYSPSEAEKFAVAQMDDSYEYTRIAALHVLKEVRSTSLDFFLRKLENDANEYVRSNVQSIREELNRRV